MDAKLVTHDGARWSNADADRVEIVEPDSSWPSRFEEEAHAFRAVLPTVPGLQIEHFGSTAIPGLRAKPIIDILIVHPAPDLWLQLVDPLASLDYVYWAENPRRDRMFFVKGMPPFGSRRTHHVHVRVPADARAELKLRDILRAKPSLARRYGDLKDVLAARYANDREAYTDTKTKFVAEVLTGGMPGGCNAV
jgi:GrpB-like predicted nucleotidyltransferase (UPF0157 family)